MCDNSNENKNTNNKKKYAVCLHNELRAVKTTTYNFYKNLIEPLDADLFIVARENYKPSTALVHMEKAISINLYEEIKDEIYINLHKLHNSDNYLNHAHLQWYYNYYKIYEIHGDTLQNDYEYVILSRTDFLHMFEFPNILNLSSEPDTVKNVIWTYEGIEYGGINPSFICVPSVYIKEYLKSFFEILQDERNTDGLNNLHLNAERYTKLIIDKNNWEIGKIQPNAFITCDSAEEKTTLGIIEYDHSTGFFYKLRNFYQQTMWNLQEYNQGKRWKYDNTGECKKILLSNDIS